MAAQGGDAGAQVNFEAIAGAAGFQIGGLRFAARGWRVEKYIENTSFARKLQFAGIAFPHIEADCAELADQRIAPRTDHTLQP